MPAFEDYVPEGVIPATLLAFNEDLSINEAETRRHLSFVAQVKDISAIAINGHASEVHACTLEEQCQLLEIAGDEIGDKVPIISGIFADGSANAARLAKRATKGGASALLCFPPSSMGLNLIQRRPEMALAHFKAIAEATDLPLIVFQYASELGYPLEALLRTVEEVPSIKAIKDWSSPQVHERHIRILQGLDRPVNVLSTNSAWLLSSLVMGPKGLLSGAGSVIADLQVSLFQAVGRGDLQYAQSLADRIWYTTNAFYCDPFGDMHNRMKEALVHLGRLDKAVVRPPLVKPTPQETKKIGELMRLAGVRKTGAEGL